MPITTRTFHLDFEGWSIEKTDAILEDGKYYAAVRIGDIFHAMQILEYVSYLTSPHGGPGELYRPIHPEMKVSDINGATKAVDTGTHWKFERATKAQHYDIEATAEGLFVSHWQPVINRAMLAVYTAADVTTRTLAANAVRALMDFGDQVQAEIEREFRTWTLGEHLIERPHDDFHRGLVVESIRAINTAWKKPKALDVITLAQRPYVERKANALITALTATPEIETRAAREHRLALVGEEVYGFEFVFASSTDGAKITGDANLPNPAWLFDQASLHAGMIRGNQVYYDASPPDVGSARPFIIRFKRPFTGSPHVGANIGSVAWTQETAYRAHKE